MGAYILVVLFSGYSSVAIEHMPMADRASCDAAAVAIRAADLKPNEKVQVLCVKSGRA